MTDPLTGQQDPNTGFIGTSDPTQDPNLAQRQALLASFLQAKSGYYAPPDTASEPPPLPQTQPAPQQPQSGFGQFLGGVGHVVQDLTSGVHAANDIGGLFGDSQIGTQAQQAIDRIPVIGRPLGFAADIATAPLTLATAGFGGVLGGIGDAAAEEALPQLGALAGPLARVGQGVAAAGASQAATGAAKALGLPQPLQLAAGLLGGAAGFGTAGNTVENLTRNAGGLLPEEVQNMMASGDTVDRFSALLSQAQPQNDALAAARHAELQDRTGQMFADLQNVSDPMERAAIVRAHQAGSLPSMLANFDPQTALTPEELSGLHSTISDFWQNAGKPASMADATHAFQDLITGQKLPTPYETNLLSAALGNQFGNVVTSLRNSGGNAFLKNALSLAGVPRALMTVGDFVYPFKQAALGVTTGSYWKAFAPMAQALMNPEYANAKMDSLLSNPDIQEAIQAGAQFTSHLANSPNQEEAFMSTMANSIPGVNLSRRGMTTFLNAYRGDLITSTRQAWRDATQATLDSGAQSQFGQNFADLTVPQMAMVRAANRDALAATEATPERIQSLSNMVNMLSGRSNDLKALLNGQNGYKVGQGLNDLFFSPQLLMSRLDAINPKTYMNLDPLVRAQAMRSVGGAFGLGLSGVAAAGLAAKAGLVPGMSVGMNPLNSNFGKINIGNTHIDLWGGFQPYARYMAQLATGKVQGSTGQVYNIPRGEVAANFVRGKLAPVPSFLVDALTGTNSQGQAVDVAQGQGLGLAATQRLTPILAQNMAQAVKADGYSGLLPYKWFPSSVSSTYTTASTIRQQGAQEMYHQNYANLTGTEQGQVNAANAEALSKVDPSSPLAAYTQKAALDQRTQEAALQQALAGGQITNAAFTKAMNDLNTNRIQQIQGVMDYTGANQGQDPTLLDRYFALRNQATTNGVVDYEKLDQLQNDFVNGLSPSDQKIISERATFQHDPSVQWWVNDKNLIQNSGYYNQQADVMTKLAPMLNAMGLNGLDYNQLQSHALSGTPSQMASSRAALTRIDALSKQQQLVMRAKDPNLDMALARVYGSKPVAYGRRA